MDQILLYQDNAHAYTYTSQTTQLEVDLVRFECLHHSPYNQIHFKYLKVLTTHFVKNVHNNKI